MHRIPVGKPEGKRPLGRPRRRWEDNIKMDLQEVGGGCGHWMELVQLNVASNAWALGIRTALVAAVSVADWSARSRYSVNGRVIGL